MTIQMGESVSADKIVDRVVKTGVEARTRMTMRSVNSRSRRRVKVCEHIPPFIQPQPQTDDQKMVYKYTRTTTDIYDV